MAATFRVSRRREGRAEALKRLSLGAYAMAPVRVAER
jgi:hypothetical protein